MDQKKWRIGVTPHREDGVQTVPERYLKSLEAIGGKGIMIRCELSQNELEALLDTLDGVMFSGGVDVDPSCYGALREPECDSSDPVRDELELRLLPLCLKRKMPILGICRGCQIINVALGGTLVQDVPTRFGKVHQMEKNAPSVFDHDVRVLKGTMLYEVMNGDVRVNSYHHQCVERLAEDLVPSAYAPEGFIEAYEFPKGEQFLLAVQWHPEMTLFVDPYSMRIFERFEQAIRAYHS